MPSEGRVPDAVQGVGLYVTRFISNLPCPLLGRDHMGQVQHLWEKWEQQGSEVVAQEFGGMRGWGGVAAR